MKLFLIFASLILCCDASLPSDHGISLIYQGKPDDALKELLPLSNAGDHRAAFYTSILLLFGEKQDIDQGLFHLKKAVDAGYGPALDTLAGLYLHGDIIAADIHKAKMYYEIAARRGYGPSQFNFGIMSKNGEGVPVDLEDAYLYLSLAADNKADLGDLTIDAEKFRHEVISRLDQEQFDRVHADFLKLKHQIAQKRVDNN